MKTKTISVDEKIREAVPEALKSLPRGRYRVTKLQKKDESETPWIEVGFTIEGEIAITTRDGSPALFVQGPGGHRDVLITSILKGVAYKEPKFLVVETYYSFYRVERMPTPRKKKKTI